MVGSRTDHMTSGALVSAREVSGAHIKCSLSSLAIRSKMCAPERMGILLMLSQRLGSAAAHRTHAEMRCGAESGAPESGRGTGGQTPVEPEGRDYSHRQTTQGDRRGDTGRRRGWRNTRAASALCFCRGDRANPTELEIRSAEVATSRGSVRRGLPAPVGWRSHLERALTPTRLGRIHAVVWSIGGPENLPYGRCVDDDEIDRRGEGSTPKERSGKRAGSLFRH